MLSSDNASQVYYDYKKEEPQDSVKPDEFYHLFIVENLDRIKPRFLIFFDQTSVNGKTLITVPSIKVESANKDPKVCFKDFVEKETDNKIDISTLVKPVSIYVPRFRNPQTGLVAELNFFRVSKLDLVLKLKNNSRYLSREYILPSEFLNLRCEPINDLLVFSPGLDGAIWRCYGDTYMNDPYGRFDGKKIRKSDTEVIKG